MTCRPDHNLQDIRAKIFPLRRRKVNAPEVTTPVSLPVKRKERSLSSLVVSTPKVPIQTGLTGRRTKAVARKAAPLRGCSFAVEGSVKREDSVEDHPVSSSSPESQVKFGRNKMQVKSYALNLFCCECLLLAIHHVAFYQCRILPWLSLPLIKSVTKT